MPVLKAQAVTCRGHGPYNLTVPGGTFAVITGASGAGKSLLLRALADLEPHGGQVSLDGQDMTDMDAPSWRRQVALLPAQTHFWADTVEAHFRQRPDIHHTARTQMQSLFSALDLSEGILGQNPEEISSGQRQRVALALALFRQPRVLILDEPTANLDPDTAVRVEHFIRDYVSAHDVPCVWVTHDPGQVNRLVRVPKPQAQLEIVAQPDDQNASQHLTLTPTGLTPSNPIPNPTKDVGP